MENDNDKKKYIVSLPDLMGEWDYEKNIEINPAEVTVGSRRTVWWKGKCGHSWDANVKERIRGYGCPICAGKRVIPGINDLLSNYTELCNEWVYEKNGGFLPTQVTPGSGKKVWWKCHKNHEYEAPINERVRGRGCPFCNGKRVMVGINDLASNNPMLAREWISDKNNTSPSNVFQYSHKKVWWRCSLCSNEWQTTVYSRTAGNGCPECSKRLQTSFPEQAIYYYIKLKHPDAINRYTQAFNNKVELDIFIPSINTAVEYDGKRWHTGKTARRRETEKYKECAKYGIKLIRIVEAENEDSDAPNCDVLINCATLEESLHELSKYISMPNAFDINASRPKIYELYIKTAIENSLEANEPNLCKEWHYEKNGNLAPSMFTPHTDAIVWWKCKEGHEWQASIAHRVDGSSCPICSNRKLLSGYNDFATNNKVDKLFIEWDHDKNEAEGVFQSDVMAGSKRKVWWRCEEGHSWKQSPQERKRGSGCPYCSGRLAISGINDLLTMNPKLCGEWDYELNDLEPTEYSVYSNKSVWWKCKEGHSWNAQIERRVKGSGCPYCTNRYVLAGFNDLESKNPDLASEWNFEKNTNLLPSQVTSGSGKKVWWKCKNGHEWMAAVKDRTKGSGCPSCRKRRKTYGN